MRPIRAYAFILVLGFCVAAPAVHRQVADPVFTGLLPAGPGQTVVVSQGNGPNAWDHIDLQQYAFDFVVGQQNFLITAAQSGTIIGINDTSGIQCSGLDWEVSPVNQRLPRCWAHANFVLIRDDDGTTASLYMHLLQGSTCSSQFCIKIGEHVGQGDPLARAGTTGWSTGIHLHFQAESIPVPQQDPYSGWWFTQSVPVHFSNPVVTAQDSDGVPKTGQAFSLGGTPPPAPAVDWNNRQYSLTCDGIAQEPVSAIFHDGKGAAAGAGIGQNYDHWDLHIQQIASGVLPSLGAVTAVLFYCSPQPSNFFNQELHVYRTADGSEIGRILDYQAPGSTGILPGVYTPGSIAIRNGQVTADEIFYGPGDSHASGPSLLRHLAWTWNGQGFTIASTQGQAAPTGACPDSAQLLSAWNAEPSALRDSWVAVPITGFTGITCWNGWVVAVPVSSSPGNGLVVFSLQGSLHLITITELQGQFRSAICSSPDAPPGWKEPPLLSCT